MVKKIFRGVALVLVLSLSLLLTGWSFGPLKGWRFYAVVSGSMEPTIPRGALIVVKKADQYHEGDIITVRGELDPKETITHRIVAIKKDEDIGKLHYVLKGDANEDPDPEAIDQDRVIGRVVRSIPYLGFLVSFAQTQTGFIILVVIPATMIIYSEFLQIKTELLKILAKRKKRNK